MSLNVSATAATAVQQSTAAAAATIATDSKPVSTIDPINAKIIQIAKAVKEKNFIEALKLTNTLPEGEVKERGNLRERVEEIVLLPIHKYYHENFDLICRYKELRLLALAGDRDAQAKLQSLHFCGVIIDKTLIDSFKRCLTIDIASDMVVNTDNNLPFVYINLSTSTLKVNITKNENGYVAEITYGEKTFKKTISKETKFLIFYSATIQNEKNIIVVESRLVPVKEQYVRDHATLLYNASNNTTTEPRRVKNPVIDEVRTMKLSNEDDFDQSTVKKIITFLKENCTLYRNESSRAAIFHYTKLIDKYSFSDCLPCDFLTQNVTIKDCSKRLIWAPDNGQLLPITLKMNDANEYRSLSDPNGFRYHLEDNTLKVTAIAAAERKWKVVTGKVYVSSEEADSKEVASELRQKMESSLSMEFVKRPWQEAALVYMQCFFKGDKRQNLTIFEDWDGEVFNGIPHGETLLQFDASPKRHCLLIKYRSEQLTNDPGGSFSLVGYSHALFLGENRNWNIEPSRHHGTALSRDSQYRERFPNGCTLQKSLPNNKVQEEDEEASAQYSIKMPFGEKFESLTVISNTIGAYDGSLMRYGVRSHDYFGGRLIYFNKPRLWFSFQYMALEFVFTQLHRMPTDLIRLIQDFDKPSMTIPLS